MFKVAPLLKQNRSCPSYKQNSSGSLCILRILNGVILRIQVPSPTLASHWAFILRRAPCSQSFPYTFKFFIGGMSEWCAGSTYS